MRKALKSDTLWLYPVLMVPSATSAGLVDGRFEYDDIMTWRGCFSTLLQLAVFCRAPLWFAA